MAAIQLSPLSDAAGKAYFLSADDPRPIWEIVDKWLGAAGLPPTRRSVPYGLALAAAKACEASWRAVGAQSEPPLTKFLVLQLTTAHWFSVEAAKRDLGWKPRVSIDEGVARLAHWARKSGT